MLTKEISDAPTILFQPPNRIGLGHMNRLACIAQALHLINPRIRTPFVVEGSSHSFLESKGLPVIPIPSTWEMFQTKAWSGWVDDDRKAKAMRLSLSILKIYNPDIVVFDGFPSLSFITSTINLGIPSAICVRKVKDFASYAGLPHVKLALDSSKAILVPHLPGDFTLSEEYSGKSLYVGEIVQPIQALDTEVETRYQLDDRPLVLITGGGGGYPGTGAFYNVALQAFSKVRDSVPKARCILMVGPLFNEWSSLHSLEGIQIVPFEPMLTSLFGRASVVVTQAGYNSIAELKMSGTETVIFPGVRAHDDQSERAAEVMATTSSMTYLKELSAESLAGHMMKALLKPHVNATRVEPSGADTAAAKLLEWLQ